MSWANELATTNELIDSLTLALGEKVLAERIARAIESYVDARLCTFKDSELSPLEEIVCRLEGK